MTHVVHEVVLTEQVPVVTKETVPVERVRIGATTVTDQQQVTGQVRKEQIDLERDLADHEPARSGRGASGPGDNRTDR